MRGKGSARSAPKKKSKARSAVPRSSSIGEFLINGNQLDETPCERWTRCEKESENYAKQRVSRDCIRVMQCDGLQ